MFRENRAVIAHIAILLVVYLSTPFVSSLSGQGVLDSISAAVFVSACCHILFLLADRAAVALAGGLLTLVIVFNIASGRYFQLQQFYPTFDSVYLMKETGSLLRAYGPQGITLLVCLVTCIFLVLLYLSWLAQSANQYSKFGSAAFLLLLSFGLQWWQFSDGDGIRFSPIDRAPISHFLRSAGVFPFGIMDIETAAHHERKAIVRALSDNPDAPLPQKYSIENLIVPLGFGPEYLSRVKSRRYPFFKNPESKTGVIDKRPNIILVVLESVRASEMGLYGAEESASPFFDSLSDNGLVVERFYSTSSYTVKSEHAILCSALDRLKGAPLAESSGSLKTVCIPKLIKGEGYQSYWFHGNELSFYNRDKYLPKLGFDHLIGEKSLNRRGNLQKLGWGIDDKELFSEVVGTLVNINQPFFAEILTLSNHLPFDYKWDIEFPDYLLPNDTLHERYRRGIYYTDQALKGFYNELKAVGLLDNSILMITGDHGVWTFSDSNLSGIQKNEQMFRVPFYIQIPGNQAGVIEGIHSHLDIAPTIVDILGIDRENGFMGQSMFSTNPEKRNRVIYSMSDNSISYRVGNRTCVPSVQCLNSLKCTGIHEENIPELVCYESQRGDDLLHNPEPASLSRVKPLLEDRLLFDYSQIALEDGAAPVSSLEISGTTE